MNVKLNGDSLISILIAAGVLVALVAANGVSRHISQRPVYEAEAHVMTTQSDATLPQTEELAWQRVERSAQWTAFVTEVRGAAQTAARLALLGTSAALTLSLLVGLVGVSLVAVRRYYTTLPDAATLVNVHGRTYLVDARSGSVLQLVDGAERAPSMVPAQAIFVSRLGGKEIRALSTTPDAWRVLDAPALEVTE